MTHVQMLRYPIGFNANFIIHHLFGSICIIIYFVLVVYLGIIVGCVVDPLTSSLLSSESGICGKDLEFYL